MAQTKIKSGLLEDNISIVGNLTVDTNTLFVDSANNRVGIGTTSPSQIFTVENNTSIFRINTATSAYPRLEIGSTTGTTAFVINRTTGSQDFKFGESSDTGNYIFRGGKLGIGIDLPNEELTIYHDTYPAIQLVNSSTGVTSSDGTIILLDTFTKDLIVRNRETANIRWYTNNTERMRIDSSGRVLINKTLSEAVGSVTPAELQIGTTGVGASIMSYANATGPGGIIVLGHGRGNSSGLLLNNDVIGQIRFAAGDGTDSQTLGAQISVEVDGTAGANDMPSRMVFSTTSDASSSPTERMRIDSSGNVGIGTTSPAVNLHINDVNGGILRLQRNDTAVAGNDSLGALEFYSNDATDAGVKAKIDTISFDSTPDGILRFHTYNEVDATLAERLRIDSSGNIGIGTTSPSAKLDVVGTIECTSLTETSALRFKENIQEDVDSSIIDKLRPVSYDWKETGDKDYGFIAEEVDELESVLTTKDEDGQLLGIKYTKLIPFLVKKIQEQEERIKQLENGKS